jgi:tRNA A-37 threonylcarbamoyl transferase component Bud32
LFKIKSGPQHLQGKKIYFDEQWRERLAEFGLKDDCDWLSLKPGKPVSESGRVNAYKVHLQNGIVYFKTYSFHGQTMDYFMRPSKCSVEVNSYQILKGIGIPTIKTLAFGEDRVAGALKSCFIVTESVEETTPLEDFAFNTWYHMEGVEKKKAFEDIFTETAKFTRIAHEAGFFHYDLKWRNILIKKEEDSYKTIWIDCPRGRKSSLRSNRGRMVDLSCLARLALSYLSKSQQYRFLKEYFGESASRSEVRNMWKLVEDHLSRRLPDPVKFPDK